MKPVAIISGDFVATGGQDAANYALACYLGKRGYELSLVAHRVANDLAALPNVRFHRARKPFNSYLLGASALRRGGRRVGESIRQQGGRVLVNGGNCDAPAVNWVHYVHSAYQPAFAGSLARNLKHRYEMSAHRREEALCFRLASRLITNSERTRRDVIRDHGVDPAKIDVIYYGIDKDRFGPASARDRETTRDRLGWSVDGTYVAFIGALGDRRKGFDTVFEAWKQLARRGGFEAKLIVIGRGAELPAWRQRAADEGIGRTIEFLGFRTDVADILTACDALVAPTRYEAYGLGVHEAICCGLPAIVSRDAGVAERYPAELHALLLPDPNDASDLAARLTMWRDDPHGWRTRVAAFGAQLRLRSWDDMAADIEQVLELE